MKTLIVMLGLTALIGCASNQEKSSEPTSSNDSAKTTQVEQSATPHAQPPKTLWSGECKKILNEAGKEVEPGSKARIQNSYIFTSDSVVWNVMNHADSECKGDVTSGDRYTFKCEGDPQKQTARCTQTKVESYDKIGWKEAKMTDSSGYSDILIMEYRMASNQPGIGKLRSRNVSEEGEWEMERLASNE